MLRRADFSGVYLSVADLNEASYDLDTKWPKDFDPEAAGCVLIEGDPAP